MWTCLHTRTYFMTKRENHWFKYQTRLTFGDYGLWADRPLGEEDLGTGLKWMVFICGKNLKGLKFRNLQYYVLHGLAFNQKKAKLIYSQFMREAIWKHLESSILNFMAVFLIRLSKSVMHPTGTFLFVFGKRIVNYNLVFDDLLDKWTKWTTVSCWHWIKQNDW